MTITSNDLLNRLRRMYAAVNATMESDMAKLPANVSQNEKSIHLVQDFSGSSSNHDFENAVQMVIANIASLHDHLKKWARVNGKNTSSIDSILASSPDLQIVHDLWNRDKHGDGRRDGGRSKRNPKLIKISRSYPKNLVSIIMHPNCTIDKKLCK